MSQKRISKLQENFTCLAIVCVDLIKLTLMEMLDYQIKPTDLYSKINSSTLISKNELRSYQMKLCYIQPPDIPDYSKFDVSLLYTLIRNLCPSLKPTGRWGEEPAAANTQLGDDIERLRLFRNREFAHANSAEISNSDFQKHWNDIQTVINRIQNNRNAGCKTDYGQKFKSIEERLLNCDDLENYKLLLEATMHVAKERNIDEPDIWIKGTEKVVCGSTAHFQATVKGKKVSYLSVIWQKISKDESKQIDKSSKKFWGKTNKELSIESVCKEDEGEYQAVLSIEEDRIKKTIQSNVIILHVVGGIPTVSTSHETCLQTHSVKLVGNVSLIDDLPVIKEIYWSKNGNKIDTQGIEGKYSKVSVDVPSLTIYNVNQYDAGHYTLIATNEAGTTVSDAIVLGAPDIALDESKEESNGSQIFNVTIKSIPAAYNIQWLVSDNSSDIFTTLDENAEEYRGTSDTLPHPVLVVRRKEQLKSNIYQIEVQNFIGGRRRKIPSSLNMFYKDRGAGAMFAKLFNELAEMFPEKKLNRIHDLILDSCKDKDRGLIPLLENAKSAREYFRILKEKELFTPSDVIFMQFLLRESNCGALDEKCIVYAKTKKALCFYEEPQRNGYKEVKFHVQGNISNYTADQIGTIKETVAAIVGCENEQIYLNGFCKSTSFLVVLSMKEIYINGLYNMKQQDSEKLISLNINYFIVDSRRVYLQNLKGRKKKHDEQLGQKITAPESLREANKSKVPKFDFQPYTTTQCGEMNVAIDFGTTFSGYAFATKSELQNYQPTIYIPHWHGLSGGMISFKTPTTILLDKFGNFVNFGFNAETTYAILVEDGKHEDYFYFRHFKMMLYDHTKSKKLTDDTMISDIRGRELPAVKVFACAIKYLIHHLLDNLKKRCLESLTINDIYWVLTTPAIWNDQAKRFMRRAAEKAGISSDKLMLALEPEAVSIYCKQLPAEKLEDPNTISTFQPGSKYLVLDAGGGTVDITVHEVQRNGQLNELERVSGGDWGGISVDMAFKSALAEIATEEMIESYSHKYPSDFIELFGNFENVKRRCKKGDDSSSVTSLGLPFSFIEECLETLGTDLTTLISNSKFKDQIIVKRARMIIQLKSFKTFFQPACNGIIKHLKELFQSPKVKGVNKIVMAGGFSESWILQDEIKNAFPDCQVIVPKEAGLAVLRGAIMFGFFPRTIALRIAKYTFGVDKNGIFKPAEHKELKKEVIEGVEYCTDIFDKHITLGQPMAYDEAGGIQFYVPITKQQNFVSFNVYSSKEKNPLYTDDCAKIGEILVNVPVGLKDRILCVRMNYGSTEITVKSFVLETGERVSAQFSFN